MAVFIRLILCVFIATDVYAEENRVGLAKTPEIINSGPNENQEYYYYKQRPTNDEAASKYDPEILERSKELRFKPGNHLPFSLKPAQNPFSLPSVIPDRVKEEGGETQYVVMYHGTTSDVLDRFLNDGIRFDVAKRTALGPGFYLAADPNEAKYYACERLKELIKSNPKSDARGMMLIVGVAAKPEVMGDVSPKILFSDSKGAPLPTYKDYMFKRNHNHYNQFVFFSNVGQYLKVFKIVVLEKGFYKSKGINDFDGLATNETISPKEEANFRCTATGLPN